MATRTSIAAVRGCIETSLTDPDIQFFVNMSNRIVTEITSNTSISELLLGDIETWFAAHLIAMGKERQTMEERLADSWVTHQGKYGEGLKSTSFGQMVLMLDPSGSFMKADKLRAAIKTVAQYPENYN